jgi:hypothetical protein
MLQQSAITSQTQRQARIEEGYQLTSDGTLSLRKSEEYHANPVSTDEGLRPVLKRTEKNKPES